MTCNEIKQAVTGLHLHLQHSERDCCSSVGVQDWNFTKHLWIVNIVSPLDLTRKVTVSKQCIYVVLCINKMLRAELILQVGEHSQNRVLKIYRCLLQ